MSETKENRKRKKILLILFILLVAGLLFFVIMKMNGHPDENIKNESVKPTTTVKQKEVSIVAGQDYDPESNLTIGKEDTVFIDTDLNTTKAGEYKVKAEVTSKSGEKEEVTYTVIVKMPESEKGCSLVYVVDKEAWSEEVWKVDKPAVEAVTEQRYVKDKDAVKEQSHYEDVWVDETGHYEQVLIKEAVAEQGHYETVHHDAVTHEEPIYETVTVYWFEFDDGTYFERTGITGSEANDVFGNYCDEYGTTGHYGNRYDNIQTGSTTVVGSEAYDEQVYVVDVPGQEAIYEQKWVVDAEGHYEKQKVIDVEAQQEQGHYETVIIKDAEPEQGHYETVIHPEEGHYEEAQGC
ncbi:MAG: hypothetical protein IJ115_09900 [Erysipelotrichaceae bacterium]|nr:hypothetical protein [Erysipelotrichaceae bacterium]